MKVRYMASPAEFRRWLEANHAQAEELWVGFHKKASGTPSITWPEAVDEALCFGWIDGVRRSVDAARYAIRFTPRRPKSVWSAINLAKVRRLIEARRMRPAGMKVYEARDPARSALYSFENRRGLGADEERTFKRNGRAWAYFQAQPPHYRRTTGWWVVSAKKEETRQRRLASLIDCSARGVWIPGFLSRPGQGGKGRNEKPPARGRPSGPARRTARRDGSRSKSG
jgi:uncharacterized protein YdeI (YjbR/CyaY-like superfamily)